MIPASCAVLSIGPSSRACTIARATAFACGSSPQVLKTVIISVNIHTQGASLCASSFSVLWAITCRAVSCRLWSILMSSGPSFPKLPCVSHGCRQAPEPAAGLVELHRGHAHVEQHRPHGSLGAHEPASPTVTPAGVLAWIASRRSCCGSALCGVRVGSACAARWREQPRHSPAPPTSV